MNLTKNQRTHKIILKNGEEIRITKKQYDIYVRELELKTYNEFIEIRDIDTNEVLFYGRSSEIKEIKEIKQTPGISGYRYICDFGVRHPLTEKCECSKKFDCIPILFRDKLEAIGIYREYARDITEADRIAYINHYLNKK